MTNLSIENVLGCTGFEFTDDYGAIDETGWVGVRDGAMTAAELDRLCARLHGTVSAADRTTLLTMGGATRYESPYGAVETAVFASSDAAYAHYNAVVTNTIDEVLDLYERSIV